MKKETTIKKCELCGLVWEDDENINSINETGRCIDCYEEFGNEYPDRI